MIFSENITYPPETIFNIHIFDIHRDPNQFPNPEIYNPDRFFFGETDVASNKNNLSQQNPYAFIPFSAGRRNCVAQKFAMLEIKLAVAEILLKFQVLPVTKCEEIIFTCNFVLQTEKPVYVRIEKR